MAKSAYFLTEEQVKLLQGTIDRVRLLPPQSPTGDDLTLDYPSPDVYIAVPQTTDGIPGLEHPVGTGTNTGTDAEAISGDVPGSAVCDVYQIIDDELIQVEGLSLTVYNLTEDRIPQDWTIIKRTKFGQWIAERQHQKRFVKTTEICTIPDYVMCELWDGPDAESLTASGTIFRVYNRLRDLGTGDWAVVELFPWGWEVTGWGC